MLFVDMTEGSPAPKRGDLVQTNAGKARERTWFILRVRHMQRSKHPRRYEVWLARWWELEPEMRMRLFASAERACIQRVIEFHRYPAKRKKRAPFAPFSL